MTEAEQSSLMGQFLDCFDIRFLAAVASARQQFDILAGLGLASASGELLRPLWRDENNQTGSEQFAAGEAGNSTLDDPRSPTAITQTQPNQ